MPTQVPAAYADSFYSIQQVNNLLNAKADKVSAFTVNDIVVLKNPDGNIKDSGHNIDDLLFDTIDGGNF